MNGIVRSYRPDKRYGWIFPLVGKPTETQCVFFHFSDVQSRDERDEPIRLGVGDEVSFTPVSSEKGTMALCIELVRRAKTGAVPAAAQAKAGKGGAFTMRVEALEKGLLELKATVQVLQKLIEAAFQH